MEKEVNRNIINDAIFDSIYSESMNDATRGTNANKGGKNSPKNNVLNCDAVKNKVREYSEHVVQFGDADFCEYENCIENILKDNKISGFTFGNIQKLINMTMKYLYVKYYGELRENFRCCHAPMDRMMCEFVYDKYIYEFNQKPKFKRSTGWGNMSREENPKEKIDNYFGFQNAIDELIANKDCLKIEFDYLNWSKTKECSLEYDFFAKRMYMCHLEI